LIYILHISDDAENDLIEASDWYEVQRKGLGTELELCIEARLTGIVRNPHHFQSKYKDVQLLLSDFHTEFTI